MDIILILIVIVIILNIALILPSSILKKVGIFLINLADDIEKENKNG